MLGNCLKKKKKKTIQKYTGISDFKITKYWY